MAEIKCVRKEMIKKWLGRRFKLRPVAIEIMNWQPGVPIKLCGRQDVDDLWLVQQVHMDTERVDLLNQRTMHVCPLPFDSIREYREDIVPQNDGFLMLKARLMIRGNEVLLEPIRTR